MFRSETIFPLNFVLRTTEVSMSGKLFPSTHAPRPESGEYSAPQKSNPISKSSKELDKSRSLQAADISISKKMANSTLMRSAAPARAPPFKKFNFCHTCATGNASTRFYFHKSDPIPAEKLL